MFLFQCAFSGYIRGTNYCIYRSETRSGITARVYEINLIQIDVRSRLFYSYQPYRIDTRTAAAVAVGKWKRRCDRDTRDEAYIVFQSSATFQVYRTHVPCNIPLIPEYTNRPATVVLTTRSISLATF